MLLLYTVCCSLTGFLSKLRCDCACVRDYTLHSTHNKIEREKWKKKRKTSNNNGNNIVCYVYTIFRLKFHAGYTFAWECEMCVFHRYTTFSLFTKVAALARTFYKRAEIFCEYKNTQQNHTHILNTHCKQQKRISFPFRFFVLTANE